MAIIPEAAAAREKLAADLENLKAAENQRLSELLTYFRYDGGEGTEPRQPSASEYVLILQAMVYALGDDTLRAHIARIRDCKKLLDSYGPNG